MILLFNRSETANTGPAKVIDIKSPQDLQRQITQTDTDGNLQTNATDKIQDMQTLTQDIKKLREEKDVLTSQIKTAIAKEKSAWHTEKQQLVEIAREEGYNKGFAAGRQDGFDDYQDLIDQANKLADVGLIDYYATVERSSEVILTLAIKTAEKILHQHLTEQPEHFFDIVKHVVAELKNQTSIAIYLSPNNYEVVLKQKEELLNVIGPDSQLLLYVQDNFEQDHCLIVHSHGQIDAGVDTQLKQIRMALEKAALEQNQ